MNLLTNFAFRNISNILCYVFFWVCCSAWNVLCQSNCHEKSLLHLSFIKTAEQQFKILVMYSPRCVKQRTALPEINYTRSRSPLVKLRTCHKLFAGNNNNNNNNSKIVIAIITVIVSWLKKISFLRQKYFSSILL